MLHIGFIEKQFYFIETTMVFKCTWNKASIFNLAQIKTWVYIEFKPWSPRINRIPLIKLNKFALHVLFDPNHFFSKLPIASSGDIWRRNK
jgi:hypothetical protein